MMKTCPINGCNVTGKMCIHKKMMLLVMIIVIVGIFFIINSKKGNSKINDLEENSNNTFTLNENISAGSYELYSPEKLAFAETGKVVLFFRATWCPSCRTIDKDIRKHLNEIPENLKILDVDYDNSSELKQKYGVTTQHTFVQVDKDGNLITKWSGGTTLLSLISQIK